MHDGRFDTLLEVVEHYDNGVQASPTTDPRLMPGGQPQNLGLTNPEKAAIVAFLETLTDPGWKELGAVVPERVPSGLPVED